MNIFPSFSSPDQTIVINLLADFVEEAETNGSNMQQYENPKAPSPRSVSGDSTPPEEKADTRMPYLVPSHSKQPSGGAEAEHAFKDIEKDDRI
ncbi:hypothetical protein ARMGADRAFT_1081060 [Armillaria gallica]|uniref:Uncharacterized protein n=1 Tax=Armillaria gallica TaxID=47427 RepID=A0A2H3DT62_ARMGA|nr:hypothetical protein ARMGADRAFT_1081060 [Armillaria gallica]